jgi:hypothetical protein
MTSLIENRTIYWLIRIPLAAYGLLLVATVPVGLLFPEIVYSETPNVPPWQFVREIDLLGYGLLLLLPHRWFMRVPLYILKLVFLSYGVFREFYMLATGVIGFVQGKKHWPIVPVALMLVLLALAAPLSIIMKKRIVNSRQSASEFDHNRS